VDKRELIFLGCIDVLVAAIVLVAYLHGTFIGSLWTGVLAISLPIVFNLVYVSERSGIRLNAPQEPLSLISADASGPVPDYRVRESEEPKTGSTKWDAPQKIWAIAAGTILAIVIASLVEAFVRKVSFLEIWPVPVLTIALVSTAFSFARNCWKTSWADADPGINLFRGLALGLLSLTAMWVLYIAVRASLGTPDASGINNEYLKQLLGLSLIRSYSYKIAHTAQA
jgi:hypothetical protein